MKKLLILPGGGVKELRPLQVLKYIEAQTNKRIVDLFDVVAGVSTGAIAALALTKENPLSAVELEQLYDSMCPTIFTASAWWKVKTLGGIAGPKYDASVLEGILKKVFGDVPVGPKAVIYTFNTTVFELQVIDALGGLKAWEAARASSAAPTYFDPFVSNKVAFMDGGIVDNNPALTTLLACAPSGIANSLLLNLQTGAIRGGWPAAQVLGWKPLEMISPVLSMAMDGGSKLADDTCRMLITAGSYLSIDAPSGRAAMDDGSPENLKALAAEGQAAVAQNKVALDAFIAKLVQP